MRSALAVVALVVRRGAAAVVVASAELQAPAETGAAGRAVVRVGGGLERGVVAAVVRVVERVEEVHDEAQALAVAQRERLLGAEVHLLRREDVADAEEGLRRRRVRVGERLEGARALPLVAGVDRDARAQV